MRLAIWKVLWTLGATKTLAMLISLLIRKYLLNAYSVPSTILDTKDRVMVEKRWEEKRRWRTGQMESYSAFQSLKVSEPHLHGESQNYTSWFNPFGLPWPNRTQIDSLRVSKVEDILWISKCKIRVKGTSMAGLGDAQCLSSLLLRVIWLLIMCPHCFYEKEIIRKSPRTIPLAKQF
jgi:hypothetical protein